jgi:hypothetical protein
VAAADVAVAAEDFDLAFLIVALCARKSLRTKFFFNKKINKKI